MSNLPSIPWTNRERAEIRGRLAALESAGPGGGGGGSTAWVDITGKPSTFPPEAHTHAIVDVTGLQAALDGKQAALVSGQATVTVPNRSFSWSETVAAAGVTPARRIVLNIGSHDDADENDAEMLDVAAMSAAAGTDQITFEMAFSTPTAGPIKINWMAV